MDSEEYSDGPPSYMESVQFQPKDPRSPPTQAEPGQIRRLLYDEIIPHISDAQFSGIPASTIVIVPSNVPSLRPSADIDPKTSSNGFHGEKIVGFPSTEELTLIRLSELEDTLEFWQRTASKQSLARNLHIYLVQEGYYFPEELARDQSFAMFTGIPLEARAGWMTSNEERLVHRQASINVSVQEVCLRVENEMCLYETKKGKALVVRVKIGGRDPHSV